MRARPAICPALIVFTSILASADSRTAWGDGPQVGPPTPARPRDQPAGPTASTRTTRPAPAAPAQAPAPVLTPTVPPLPGDVGDKATATAAPLPTPVVAPGTLAEASRTRSGTEARLKDLDVPDKKDNPATKGNVEILQRRLRLLDEWKVLAEKRAQAEHPNPSPDQVAGEAKAELEKTRTLLDQAAKTPASLLPEAFGPTPAGAPAKSPEARLAEMKDAIDAARLDLKDRSAELQKLQAGTTSSPATDPATLKAERDKTHQSLAALGAARPEREAAIASASGPEARDLARDKFINYEWEYRVEVERQAMLEAQITLAARQAELIALQVQAKASRVDLNRRIVELMERQYANQSERQQKDLQQAVAKEETKAEQTADVLERYRAQRTADLLRLEAEAVAYEKALATTSGNLSVDEQNRLANKTVAYFEKNVKQPLNDGNVSPLDVILVKNAFRRIGPLRAAIVKGDLAAVRNQLTSYENALAEVEMDLVNDDRDDRYDRESLLDKLPEARHHEAEVMLDAMETRHHLLLNRLRDVLQHLAQRAEGTQAEIQRRIRTLDDEYTFIRTHIFWVRDAEPVGVATLVHARSEAVRAARALIKLGGELGDRSLWGKVAPDFILALVGLVVLPFPLWMGQRAIDRLRLAAPDPTMNAENAPSAVVG